MVTEGTLELDRDGLVIHVSPALEKMLGLSEDIAIGRSFTMLVRAGERLLNDANASSRLSSREAVLVCKDGLERRGRVTVHPLRDRSGELLSYLVTVAVSSDDEAIDLMPDVFTGMFNLSSDAVLVTGADGRIINVNRAFLETYGYTAEEVIGEKPGILRSRHTKDEQYEEMWRDILDPAKGWWKGEIINVTRNGDEVPVLLSVNAVRDTSGAIRNFLGTAIDMRRAKELEKVRKLYIDYIVHDIRNPLATITSSAELMLMLDADNLDEGVKKKVRTIAECGRKINAMTSDILEFSRAENGMLVINRSSFDLAKLITEAYASFASSRKMLFVNGFPCGDVSFEGVMVNADPEKLQRIIYNLLNNAFKYAESMVKMEVESTDGGLSVTVADDGDGLPAEEVERIFDAFYQAEGSVKAGGAGLGLSIVKTFTEAHGGRVWVERAGDYGLKFGFFIPKATDAEPSSPEKAFARG